MLFEGHGVEILYNQSSQMILDSGIFTTMVHRARRSFSPRGLVSLPVLTRSTNTTVRQTARLSYPIQNIMQSVR